MQALTARRLSPPTTVARAEGVPTATAVSARSATMTVQAPQSPSAQPSLVPVQCASSRSQSSTLWVVAVPATAATWPRCTKRMGRVAAGSGCMRERYDEPAAPMQGREWLR